MKAVLTFVTASAAIVLFTTDLPAQYPYAAQPYCYYQPSYPVAPDMCGPGSYYTNGYQWYGPSYNVYPPFSPVGTLPPSFPQRQPEVWFNRSPRDFFMWSEAQRNILTRETRPPFVP